MAKLQVQYKDGRTLTIDGVLSISNDPKRSNFIKLKFEKFNTETFVQLSPDVLFYSNIKNSEYEKHTPIGNCSK